MQKVLLVVAAAFGIQIAGWALLYPILGYNNGTVTLLQVSVLAGGVVSIAAIRLGWRSIGLDLGELGRALLGIAGAYAGLFILAAAGNQLFHCGLPLFRSQHRLDALLDNWLLTGLGEELLFTGVLLNLVLQYRGGKRTWAALVLVGLLFGVWHAPATLPFKRRWVERWGKWRLNRSAGSSSVGCTSWALTCGWRFLPMALPITA